MNLPLKYPVYLFFIILSCCAACSFTKRIPKTKSSLPPNHVVYQPLLINQFKHDTLIVNGKSMSVEDYQKYLQDFYVAKFKPEFVELANTNRRLEGDIRFLNDNDDSLRKRYRATVTDLRRQNHIEDSISDAKANENSRLKDSLLSYARKSSRQQLETLNANQETVKTSVATSIIIFILVLSLFYRFQKLVKKVDRLAKSIENE